MKKRLIMMLLIAFCAQGMYAQGLRQTIRGQVVDKLTQQVLPGANVIVLGSSPILGSSTDMDGNFKIEKVALGRVSLAVSFMGYNSTTVPNLEVNSGKELVVKIEMDEQVVVTNEVVVKAQRDKVRALNDMALISARTFSVEESQRYAGARNDVARMAANYAGVSSNNDSENGIVIRGNSPNGLLWRMEDVEIPNPNHFGQSGATGGPVSMLNNNVLSNSDFMTAAFPAEYGNALSGVFDLRLRKGNNEKHEFLGQIGFNGFELGAEGPLFGIKGASYLINYRYSTLAVFNKMGIEFGTGTAVPYYQDLSFNICIPTKNVKTNLFGMGGKSNIDFLASKDDTTKVNTSLYGDQELDVYNKNKSGVIGLSQTYTFSNNTFAKLTLAATGIENTNKVDSVVRKSRQPLPYFGLDQVNYSYIASLFLNHKVNSRNNFRIGITATRVGFNLIDSLYQKAWNEFRIGLNGKGGSNTLNSYAQWQHKFNDVLTLNAGLHSQYYALNGSKTIEPRVGLKWQFNPKQSVNIGFGNHSRMMPIQYLFTQVKKSNGVTEQPNQNLDFYKANHFVLGYDNRLSETLRLKAEAYYQDIYNVPVSTQADSYSSLNLGSMNFSLADYMENSGTGRNYGVEVTLEKFLDRGFYYLITTSLFDSKYKGKDGVERSTAFDSKYVVNFLAGKEFQIGESDGAKRKLIVIDSKITAAGGQRYTPLDLEKSRELGKSSFRKEEAFSKQLADYLRIDLRIAFKLDGKSTSQEWVIDVQNLSNHQNPYGKQYNIITGAERTVYQLGIFPMMQYKIMF